MDRGRRDGSQHAPSEGSLQPATGARARHPGPLARATLSRPPAPSCSDTAWPSQLLRPTQSLLSPRPGRARSQPGLVSRSPPLVSRRILPSPAHQLRSSSSAPPRPAASQKRPAKLPLRRSHLRNPRQRLRPRPSVRVRPRAVPPAFSSLPRTRLPKTELPAQKRPGSTISTQTEHRSSKSPIPRASKSAAPWCSSRCRHPPASASCTTGLARACVLEGSEVTDSSISPSSSPRSPPTVVAPRSPWRASTASSTDSITRRVAAASTADLSPNASALL
jgi:hypothetical protein